MKKEQVLEIIRKTNQETKEIAESIANKVNSDQELDTYFSKWLAGTNEFNKRYDTVHAILKELRNEGWDVKMNMQSYELSFWGSIEK